MECVWCKLWSNCPKTGQGGLVSACLERPSVFVNDMQSQIFTLASRAGPAQTNTIGRATAADLSTNEKRDVNQALREAGLSLTVYKLKLKAVCHRHALSTIEYKQPAGFLLHINSQ